MTTVDIGPVSVGNDLPFVLISGPCQLETLDHARMLAERLVSITSDHSSGTPSCKGSTPRASPAAKTTRSTWRPGGRAA